MFSKIVPFKKGRQTMYGYHYRLTMFVDGVAKPFDRQFENMSSALNMGREMKRVSDRYSHFFVELKRDE